MKNISIFILIFTIYLNCYSQQYSQEELKSKLQVSLKQRQIGQELVVAGVMLDVIGVVYLVKGTNEERTNLGNIFNTNHEKEDAREFWMGLLLVVVGDAALFTGIPFWISGSKKFDRYKKLLNNSEKKLSLKVNNRGIGLQYSF